MSLFTLVSVELTFSTRTPFANIRIAFRGQKYFCRTDETEGELLQGEFCQLSFVTLSVNSTFKLYVSSPPPSYLALSAVISQYTMLHWCKLLLSHFIFSDLESCRYDNTKLCLFDVYSLDTSCIVVCFQIFQRILLRRIVFEVIWLHLLLSLA